MTTEEAKEVLGDVRAYLACRAILENEILAGHTFTDICNAIKTLEQEPFINKPCISKGVCHEDKIKVLDKISAEIAKLITESVRVNPWGKDYRKGLMKAMAIIERNVGE